MLSYIKEDRLTIATNHNSLSWIFNLKGISQNFVWLRLRLFYIDIDLENRASVNNHAADALSGFLADGL